MDKEDENIIKVGTKVKVPAINNGTWIVDSFYVENKQALAIIRTNQWYETVSVELLKFAEPALKE